MLRGLDNVFLCCCWLMAEAALTDVQASWLVLLVGARWWPFRRDPWRSTDLVELFVLSFGLWIGFGLDLVWLGALASLTRWSSWKA